MNLNQELLHHHNINSNWKYRKFLQQNADKIMELNNLSHITSDTPLYFNNQYPQPASDLKSNYLNKCNYKAHIISPEINQNNIL